MKKFNLRQTFINGAFFALPVMALLYLGIKIVHIIEKIIAPTAQKLGIQHLLGQLTLTILAVIILLIACFVLGILLHLKMMQHINRQVENLAYKFVPQLNKLKSFALQDESVAQGNQWKTVLLQEGDSWVPACIIAKGETWTTVFFPEPPDGLSGSIKLISTTLMNYQPIDGRKFYSIIQQYGQGLLEAKDKLK